MSNPYNNVVAALSADADLREKVMAVSTPEERAAILTAAGLELPTAEEIEAVKLAGLTGGAAMDGSISYMTNCAVSNAAACGG